MEFRTSNNDIVTDEKLQEAINYVSDWMVNLAGKIRKEDAYASHVPESVKDSLMVDYINYAEEVRKGNHLNNFTIWQRINEYLTGDCVALLK